MAIAELVAQGLPLKGAAPLCGVLSTTAQGWVTQGRENPQGTFGPFALAIEMASGVTMAETIHQWRDIGAETKQWTAWATFAERMWPNEFGKKSDNKPQTVVNIGIVDGRVQELTQKGELTYGGN